MCKSFFQLIYYHVNLQHIDWLWWLVKLEKAERDRLHGPTELVVPLRFKEKPGGKKSETLKILQQSGWHPACFVYHSDKVMHTNIHFSQGVLKMSLRNPYGAKYGFLRDHRRKDSLIWRSRNLKRSNERIVTGVSSALCRRECITH